MTKISIGDWTSTDKYVGQPAQYQNSCLQKRGACSFLPQKVTKVKAIVNGKRKRGRERESKKKKRAVSGWWQSGDLSSLVLSLPARKDDPKAVPLSYPSSLLSSHSRFTLLEAGPFFSAHIRIVTSCEWNTFPWGGKKTKKNWCKWPLLPPKKGLQNTQPFHSFALVTYVDM